MQVSQRDVVVLGLRDDLRVQLDLVDLAVARARKRFEAGMHDEDVRGGRRVGSHRADVLREAVCRGLIRYEPAGARGFGYDPLFEIPEYHRTFAELGERVKHALSHRARAVGLLVPQLIHLLDSGRWTDE